MFRYFRGYIIVPLAILLLCAAVIPYSASCTESRPEFYYGNIVAGVDFINSGMSQELFHQETLATADQGALAISFPAGPGGASIAPAIAQTSSSTVAATSTGLFNSNFQFCPGINLGAAPVGVGKFGVPSPVTRARFSGNSLMFPEMTVEGNLLANGNYTRMQDSGITLPPPMASNAYDKVRSLSYLEKNRGVQGFSAQESGLPVILSGRTVDFESTPAEINNTSIVDRLWRNSHQANALNNFYEGEAARPTWIAPVTNPYELIDCGVMSDAIKSGLEMTRPGKYLTPAFWNI